MNTDRDSEPAVGTEEWHKALEVRMARPGQAEAEAWAASAALLQKLERDLDRQKRVGFAETLMAWAYASDPDQVRALLGAIPAYQVREISAAATLLASTANAVLTEDTSIE